MPNCSSLQENGKNPLSQPIVPLSPKKRGGFYDHLQNKETHPTVVAEISSEQFPTHCDLYDFSYTMSFLKF